MKMRELQEDDFIVEWFDIKKPTGNTPHNYLYAMQKFTDFLGKTPKELVIEAENDIKAGLLPRERSIKKYFIRFRKLLEDEGLFESSIKTNVAAIKSFYDAFEIDLPKLSRLDNTATVKEENTPIPTKSDLQDVLKVCNPLEKALVLIGTSSGLSRIDIIKLTVKQFKDGYDPVTKITTLPLRRTKRKNDFITFLSPEASQAILDYLEYRNRKAKSGKEERDEQLEKQKVFSDKNYLLCKQNIPNSFLITKDDKERQLNKDVIMKTYRTISEKAGKNTPDGYWNLIRSHKVRAFFNNTLKSAGCDSFHVEFWMGHKISPTQKSYFVGDTESEKKIYQEYVPYLTIQKELDISESPEYQKIKHENQVLQAETARHVVERAEMQEFRSELEIMKKIMGESHIIKDYTSKMEIVKDNLQKNQKVSRDEN